MSQIVACDLARAKPVCDSRFLTNSCHKNWIIDRRTRDCRHGDEYTSYVVAGDVFQGTENTLVPNDM